MSELKELWQTFSARILAANIHGEKRLWSFETYPHNGRSDSELATFYTLEQWAKQDFPPKRGVLLTGPSGTGKTGLAIAAANQRIKVGEGKEYFWFLTANKGVMMSVAEKRMRQRVAPVWFETWPRLSQRFRQARQVSYPDENTVNDIQLFDEIKERVSLLVIDDIDVGEITPFKEEILLQLIDLVDEGTKIILTMNYNPVDAARESRLSERVIDRITGNKFLALQMRGRSLRG